MLAGHRRRRIRQRLPGGQGGFCKAAEVFQGVRGRPGLRSGCAVFLPGQRGLGTQLARLLRRGKAWPGINRAAFASDKRRHPPTQ